MAALIRQNRLQGERVGEYQVFVRNLVFYTGFRHVQVYDDAGAVGSWSRPIASSSWSHARISNACSR